MLNPPASTGRPRPDLIDGGPSAGDGAKTTVWSHSGGTGPVVGAVDQVCLAAIPARFNSARLFSLIVAVLVVDEVHAFDTYTEHLLQSALRMHAALGGSAILLSATIDRSL